MLVAEFGLARARAETPGCAHVVVRGPFGGASRRELPH
jgi:hypothetical protein